MNNLTIVRAVHRDDFEVVEDFGATWFSANVANDVCWEDVTLAYSNDGKVLGFIVEWGILSDIMDSIPWPDSAQHGGFLAPYHLLEDLLVGAQVSSAALVVELETAELNDVSDDRFMTIYNVLLGFVRKAAAQTDRLLIVE